MLLLVACQAPPDGSPASADRVAEYAHQRYADSAIATLADLVAFKTVHDEGIENADHPEFRRMSAYLQARAEQLGLDFADHGAVLVIGLGDAEDRLGLITHGDVQPADPAKWAEDPFSLDSLSEPGRLVGRGVEDDKGPIALALYAMKAVKDRGVPLTRRIELIISQTEESDWEPFREYLRANEPPAINVALDSEYPLVVAEKGWNAIYLTMPPPRVGRAFPPNRIVSFTGGAFISQIPEDARAVIADATREREAGLKAIAAELRFPDVDFTFEREGGSLTVNARGRAAHSSTPSEGRNAITHLAALLGEAEWPSTHGARMVRLINDLVGTGDYAEKFGDVAASHPFMGPLTLSLTTLKAEGGDLVAAINIRSPAGRTQEELRGLIRAAIDDWKRRAGIAALRDSMRTNDAYYLEDAPHIPVLLDIFARHTGNPDPQPISIGGGTHARLVPNGVNFGPAMPGEEYTGHSEHEFMRRELLLLSLKMYTAMLVQLGVG